MWCDPRSWFCSHPAMWHIPDFGACVFQTREGLYRLIVRHGTNTHTHTHRATHTRSHTHKQNHLRSHREPRNSSRTTIAAAALLLMPIVESALGSARSSLLPLFVPKNLSCLTWALSPCTACHRNYSRPLPLTPTLPLQSLILSPKNPRRKVESTIHPTEACQCLTLSYGCFFVPCHCLTIPTLLWLLLLCLSWSTLPLFSLPPF